MNITIRYSTPKDLEKYTDLLQQTYEYAYSDESIGLTKDCFSKSIFNTQNTQDYLKSYLINNDSQKTWLAFNEQRLIGSITCIIIKMIKRRD
jgi:hypothetical protein